MAEGWEIIESVDVSSNTSSVTFSSIPTYFHLMLDFHWSCASSGDSMKIRIHGDTASNYDNGRNYNANSSAYKSYSSSQSYFNCTGDVSNSTEYPIVGQVWFTDVDNASKYRQCLAIAGSKTTWSVMTGSHKAYNTITQIEVKTNVSNNIRAGSHFQLWGLKSS